MVTFRQIFCHSPLLVLTIMRSLHAAIVIVVPDDLE